MALRSALGGDSASDLNKQRRQGQVLSLGQHQPSATHKRGFGGQEERFRQSTAEGAVEVNHPTSLGPGSYSPSDPTEVHHNEHDSTAIWMGGTASRFLPANLREREERRGQMVGPGAYDTDAGFEQSVDHSGQSFSIPKGTERFVTTTTEGAVEVNHPSNIGPGAYNVVTGFDRHDDDNIDHSILMGGKGERFVATTAEGAVEVNRPSDLGPGYYSPSDPSNVHHNANDSTAIYMGGTTDRFRPHTLGERDQQRGNTVGPGAYNVVTGFDRHDDDNIDHSILMGGKGERFVTTTAEGAVEVNHPSNIGPGAYNVVTGFDRHDDDNIDHSILMGGKGERFVATTTEGAVEVNRPSDLGPGYYNPSNPSDVRHNENDSTAIFMGGTTDRFRPQTLGERDRRRGSAAGPGAYSPTYSTDISYNARSAQDSGKRSTLGGTGARFVDRTANGGILLHKNEPRPRPQKTSTTLKSVATAARAAARARGTRAPRGSTGNTATAHRSRNVASPSTPTANLPDANDVEAMQERLRDPGLSPAQRAGLQRRLNVKRAQAARRNREAKGSFGGTGHAPAGSF